MSFGLVPIYEILNKKQEEENKVKILNMAISATEGSYPGTKLFCAIMVYEEASE